MHKSKILNYIHAYLHKGLIKTGKRVGNMLSSHCIEHFWPLSSTSSEESPTLLHVHDGRQLEQRALWLDGAALGVEFLQVF